jgi:hypothetical protein
MSDIREKQAHLVEARRILQTMPSHYGLIKVNRILLAIVLSLMFLVLVLGFLLVPDHDLVLRNKSVSDNGYLREMNPVLSADVNALKAQMIGLVSGSIESKLRMLEESVRMGTAANSLGTIQDLKNDVKVLRSYSQPAEKIDSKERIANEQVLREISQLKHLIYVSLASCGLMLAAVAGIWLKNSNRLSYVKAITHYLSKR